MKCAGTVKEVCRYGTRSVPVRYQKCAGTVPEVCRYGTRSVPAWHQKFALQYQNCASTVPEVIGHDSGTCGRSGSNFMTTGCPFTSGTKKWK